MTATLIWHGKEYVVETPCSVKDALATVHLDTEAHLVMRNGKLICEEEMLQDGDMVKLIPVMIGG